MSKFLFCDLLNNSFKAVLSMKETLTLVSFYMKWGLKLPFCVMVSSSDFPSGMCVGLGFFLA